MGALVDLRPHGLCHRLGTCSMLVRLQMHLWLCCIRMHALAAEQSAHRTVAQWSPGGARAMCIILYNVFRCRLRVFGAPSRVVLLGRGLQEACVGWLAGVWL